MRIDQFLPTYSPRDAIGNEVTEINKCLQEWGYSSEVFAENFNPPCTGRNYLEYTKIASEENIIFYHHSIGSNIPDFLKDLPGKIIVRYHGITPTKYIADVNQYIAYLLTQGREQLQLLSPITKLALPNSQYTENELIENNFKQTQIIPLLIDYEQSCKSNEKILAQYDDHFINIIYVGRIIPQKHQETVINIFNIYQKINPNSRLFLIGNAVDFEGYLQNLLKLINTLAIKNVYITGSVTNEDLAAYYQLADIFLCMSEWETFCVPLVESMSYKTPIIALNNTAIPGTLGNAGVLINTIHYDEIAELIDLIIHDESLQKRIITTQNKRYNELSYPRTKENLRIILEDFIHEKLS